MRTPRFEHPFGLVPLIGPEQSGSRSISPNGKDFGHSLYLIFGIMVLFLKIFPYRPRSPPDRQVPEARLAGTDPDKAAPTNRLTEELC